VRIPLLYVHFFRGNTEIMFIFHREGDCSSSRNLSKKLPDGLRPDSAVDWGRERGGERMGRGGSAHQTVD